MKRITKVTTLVMIGLLAMLLVAVPVQQAKAQFVLAYTYPDNNGTGFSVIQIWLDDEVNTLYSKNDDPGGPLNNGSISTDTTVENITLVAQCWLNGTYYGVASLEEGLAIIRVLVDVVLYNGTSVFSKTMTNYVNTDGGAPQYWYSYSDQLEFTLSQGLIYSCQVTFEVFGG